MVSYNAMYVNGGMINEADLTFLASKQIFYLLWEVCLLGTGNQLQYRYTQQDIAAKVDWIHSFDSRFKVLSWFAVYTPAAGTPDLSTPAQRADVVAKETQHVQDCHFDGLNSDYEGIGMDAVPWTERNATWLELYNAETTAMHNIGKLSVPFMYGGAGLWVGNFYGDPASSTVGYVNEVIKKLHADAVSTGFGVYTETGEEIDAEYNYFAPDGTTELMGYIPTMRGWTEFCPTPLLNYMGHYENFPRMMGWVDDYIAQYGLSNIAGFNLYDYVGGKDGTPPANQQGAIDSPYTESEWALWDAWTPKNLTSPVGIPLWLLATLAIAPPLGYYLYTKVT